MTDIPGGADVSAGIPDPDISELTPVYLIHDAALGSPPDTAQYAGRVVAVPPWRIPLPTRGKLFGMRGFSRQTAVDGENLLRWEWVLQGDTDPVDAFVDGLVTPLGGGGWQVPTARSAVKTMIQRMFTAGIPRATIVNQVPAFFQAVAAEVAARSSTPK